MSPPSVVAGVTPLEFPADDDTIAVSINAELDPEADNPGVGGPSGSGVGLPKEKPTGLLMEPFPKMDEEDEVGVEVVLPKKEVVAGVVPSAFFSVLGELAPNGLKEVPPKIDVDFGENEKPVDVEAEEEVSILGALSEADVGKENGFGALDEVDAAKGVAVEVLPEGGVEKNEGLNPVGLKPTESEDDEAEGVDDPKMKLLPFGGTGNDGVPDVDPNIEVDPPEPFGGPVAGFARWAVNSLSTVCLRALYLSKRLEASKNGSSSSDFPIAAFKETFRPRSEL